jgi:hypothetical protein
MTLVLLGILVWLIYILALKAQGRKYDLETGISGISVTGEVSVPDGYQVLPETIFVAWNNFDNKELTLANQNSKLSFQIPNANLLKRVNFIITGSVLSEKTGNEFAFSKQVSKFVKSRKVVLGTIDYTPEADYGYLVSVVKKNGGAGSELPRSGSVFDAQVGDIISFETLWLNTANPKAAPYQNIKKQLVFSGDDILSEVDGFYKIVKKGLTEVTMYCSYEADGKTLSIGLPVTVQVEVK